MKKTLFFILISLSLFAHEGGHYGQQDILRIWHLTDGSIIRGNYSSATSDALILEQYEGKKVRISLAELSPRDQKFAAVKMERGMQINSYIEVEKPVSYLYLDELLFIPFLLPFWRLPVKQFLKLRL